MKKYMLDIAHCIICMEQIHADYIIQNIDKKNAHKIHVLSLGDTETFMTPTLIKMLEEKIFFGQANLSSFPVV